MQMSRSAGKSERCTSVPSLVGVCIMNIVMEFIRILADSVGSPEETQSHVPRADTTQRRTQAQLTHGTLSIVCLELLKLEITLYKN